jgi:hypothetical protein
MESWRVPLASIRQFPTGQFGTPESDGGQPKGQRLKINWFQKGDQLGWSHSPRGAFDTGNQLVTKKY